MTHDFKYPDPWSQTIEMLHTRTNALCTSAARQAHRDHAAIMVNAFERALVVSVLERPTATTATIYWRDATRGCYGDQAWRVSHARKGGVCAMSGVTIVPGDRVYRPSRRSTVCNADTMILAAVLENEAPA